MTEKKYSFDKVKMILIAAVVIMFGLLTRQCDDTEAVETDHLKDSLKTTIRNQKRISDSLKLVANGNDSVRLEYITKWRTKIKTIIQHDSIPCDSILPMVVSTCDSIISKDSIYIKDLRDIIYTDSIIMDSQAQVIKLDSIKIADLDRKVVRLKRHRRWLLFGTGVLGGAVLINNR
jgi:hypothetical protein